MKSKYPNKPTKEELYEMYIVNNMTAKQISEKLNINLKTVQRWCELAKFKKDRITINKNIKQGFIDKYGTHPMNIPEIKAKTNTPESLKKAKETCMQRYGYEAFVAIPDIHKKSTTAFARAKGKQTCKARYGVEYPVNISGVSESGNSLEARQKAHETKKRNDSYGKSKEEDKVYEILCKRYKEVIRQYSDDRYPFPCDFYIPEEDLFIEYNGYFTHGTEPFDKSNPRHLEFVEYWKQKAKEEPHGHGYHVLRTFVKNDPLKRELVKKRKLKWKEFFTLAEVEDYYGKE